MTATRTTPKLAAPILERLGLTATFFVATGFLAGGCMWNDQIIEAIRHCRLEQLDLTNIGLGPLRLESPAARRRAVLTLLNGIKHRIADDRTAAVDAVVKARRLGRSAVADDEFEQVRRLGQQGMDVGAHTVSHPILTRLGPAAGRQEIRSSKEHLEQAIPTNE